MEAAHSASGQISPDEIKSYSWVGQRPGCPVRPHEDWRGNQSSTVELYEGEDGKLKERSHFFFFFPLLLTEAMQQPGTLKGRGTQNAHYRWPTILLPSFPIEHCNFFCLLHIRSGKPKSGVCMLLQRNMKNNLQPHVIWSLCYGPTP